MTTTESGDQFVPSYFDFLNSKLMTRICDCPYGLYLVMRRYVCRAKSDHQLSEFYRRGYLATEGYLETWANIFGKSKSTISRWLKTLEDENTISCYKKSAKGESSNIYILGVVEWISGSNRPIEKFFIDHASSGQEDHEFVHECTLPNSGEIEWPDKSFSVAFLQHSAEHSAEHSVQPSNREEVIEKSNKLPQPSVAATADLEELQYVDLEEETTKPKWARPETVEQQGMLSITNRKWFQSGEKSKTKAILKALNVGTMLGNDVYGECIRQIGDRKQLDFATLPPLPNSWLEWRREHAKRNRWSYSGLLNALIDRDQLVKHCRYMLKEMGASENIPKVEIENGVRITTLAHDPSQGPMPKYAGPEEGRIEI